MEVVLLHSSVRTKAGSSISNSLANNALTGLRERPDSVKSQSECFASDHRPVAYELA